MQCFRRCWKLDGLSSCELQISSVDRGHKALNDVLELSTNG